MSIQQIEMLPGLRKRLLRVVDGISSEELLWVPPGFRNNVLWNLGHLLVVQQNFCYRNAGQPVRIPDEFAGVYGGGTSPADWNGTPDVELLLGLLEQTAAWLAEDYQAGRLANYQPFTTKSGLTIATIEDALSFNEFHEGLHSGIIECMRRLWRAHSEGNLKS